MNTIQNSLQYKSNVVLPEPVNLIVANTSQLQLPKIAPTVRKSTTLPKASIGTRGSSAHSLGDDLNKLKDYDAFHSGLDNSLLQKKPTRSLTLINLSTKNIRPINDLTTSIPENIKTVFTPDISKTPLPVFGRRPDSMVSLAKSEKVHKQPENHQHSSLSAIEKADIEEVYLILKDRIRSAFYDTKKKFRSADPDGRGVISRDALGHIVAAMLGPLKPISHQEFLRLLERLNLRNKSFIKFDEFLGCFQEMKHESSEWVDPVRVNHANINSYVFRKATQVAVILKEKCKQRSKDMVDLIPQLIGGNPTKIFKPELLNSISRMNIKMESDEFEKLWKRFDTDHLGIVSSDVFLKKIGLNERSADPLKINSIKSAPADVLSVLNDIPIPNVNIESFKSNEQSRLVSRDLNQSPIGKWLKYRFREGFMQLKEAFETVDISNSSYVSREKFLEILDKFGLKLEIGLLDAFLQRCEISTNGSALVPYRVFLEKFQNRNEDGATYKKIAGRRDVNRENSSISTLERSLLHMFQKEFLSLLSKLRKHDRNKTNLLAKKEFRAVIESHFNIELTDAEFNEFCKDIPFDENQQYIKYLEFMARFDSDDTTSLFESKSDNFDKYIGSARTKLFDLFGDKDDGFKAAGKPRNDLFDLDEDFESIDGEKEVSAPRRIREIRQIIKNYVKLNYKEIETKWANIDVFNTGEMTKDMLCELLNSEIDVLWKEFILKDNNKLDYWQFIRHFGYSKQSAAFKNARLAPPKRGDSDVFLTSKNLGRDNMIIRGSVQAKIQLQSETMRIAFQNYDPLNNGFISKLDFEQTLLDFCPELNEDELEYLCRKYVNPSDGRIRYNDFLEPFILKLRRKPSIMLTQSEHDSVVLTNIRKKLAGRHRALKRFFKQKDYENTGYVAITDFKDGFKHVEVLLSNEELYILDSKLDSDMLGLIDYKKFINEYLRNDE